MIVRVAELTAATRDAHVALCRALLGLDLMEKVVFGTHPADPLPYLLTDARLARVTHYEDDLWLRIMDIRVLRSRRAPTGRAVHGASRCPTDSAATVADSRWRFAMVARGARRPMRPPKCTWTSTYSAACTWVPTARRHSPRQTGCAATTPSLIAQLDAAFRQRHSRPVGVRLLGAGVAVLVPHLDHRRAGSPRRGPGRRGGSRPAGDTARRRAASTRHAVRGRTARCGRGRRATSGPGP